MKKIFKFLIILLPWLISGLFIGNNSNYYKSLNRPNFAPNPIVFQIVWILLYILISYSIYLIYTNNNCKNIQNYNKTLLINYFSNQIFTFLFFTLKSPFLGLIDTFIVLISSLFLYYETKNCNKNAAKFLIPYILWNIFAVILITSIVFKN